MATSRSPRPSSPSPSPSPVTSLPPSPSSWLPPTVTQRDPILLARALQWIHHAPFIDPSHRHYLAALLPLVVPEMVHRIMNLTPVLLSTLCSVLSSALRAVRSWGGGQEKNPTSKPKRKTMTTIKTKPNPATSAQPPASSATATTTTTTAAAPPPPPQSPYQALATALAIQHAVPPFPTPPASSPTASPMTRATQRVGCATRQSGCCLITRDAHDGSSDSCHLFSDSVSTVAGPTEGLTWFLLAIVLGELARDQLYTIVGGTRSYSPGNAVILTATFHRLFDRGSFWLVPVQTSNTKIPADARTYDVEFQWMTSPKLLDTHHVVTPQNPTDQILQLSNGKRQLSPNLQHARPLRHGDRFRLFTNNPANYPLPHTMLLELRARLWAMIFAAGLGAPHRTLKRKEREDDSVERGDDDGDDDEEYNGKSKGTAEDREDGRDQTAGDLRGGRRPSSAGSKKQRIDPAGKRMTSISTSFKADTSNSVYRDSLLPMADYRTDPWLCAEIDAHHRAIILGSEQYKQVAYDEDRPIGFESLTDNRHDDGYYSTGASDSCWSSESESESESEDEGSEEEEDSWLVAEIAAAKAYARV